MVLKKYSKLSISQLFEELQGWNLELKLITPIYIIVSYFGIMAAILDFLNVHITACLKSYRAEIQNLSYLLLHLLLAAILDFLNVHILAILRVLLDAAT